MKFLPKYLMSKPKQQRMLIKSELSQVIIKAPLSVKPTTSLLEAREILFKYKIGRLVVLGKNNKPVGIITEKDVAKRIYTLGNRSIKSVQVGDFMSKNLITVNKKNTIYDCANLMRNKKISSIIVLNDNGTLAGMVTKKDLVSLFLTQSTTPLKVSRVMTRKVVTVMPNDSIILAENLLISNKISRIIVQRNRRPVGIITHRNFLPAKIPLWLADVSEPKEVERYRLESFMTEFHTNQLSYLLPFKAVDIMTPNPITIDPNEDVSVAALLMIRHNISGLPVVQKSRLVGIITKSDIIRIIAQH